MTMRNRAPRALRKDPIFITSRMTFTVPAAGTTVADGGLFSSIQASTDFETRTGRTLRNATIARIWLHGLYTTSAVVTTPQQSGLFLGAIVLTEKVEDVDFPELQDHAGDWMLHDARNLLQVATTALQTPLQPQDTPAGSVVMLDNKSKRLIRRDTDKLFFAVAKDVVLEEPVDFRCEATVMWLVP